VRVSVLASSSSGNSTFVHAGGTRLLVDAGLSGKETKARLAAIGEEASQLDAIVITHEHSDHVAGLPALAKNLRIPVYLSRLTAPLIDWGEMKRGVQPRVETFQAGSAFRVGEIEIETFTIPHDAVDPVGLTFRHEGLKAAVVTDLGYIPENVKFHLRGTHLLLLESNHDLDMLKVGPYPWALKQRVMSRKGHLSNDVTAQFIEHDLDACAQTLILGHLSENNNYPALVDLIARQAIGQRGLPVRLAVAEPGRQSEVFTLERGAGSAG